MALTFLNFPVAINSSITRRCSLGSLSAVRESCFLNSQTLLYVKHIRSRVIRGILWSNKVNCQIVYETNSDYDKTHDVLCSNQLLVVDKTQKGLVWFKFKKFKTVFLLSPKGIMQVKWNEPEEKKVLLALVENLLVPREGEKLVVSPSKQQVWVSYPPPEDFKLYWCRETTEYGLKLPHIGFFDWLDRRAERKRIEREKAIKEGLARDWSYMELLAKTNPQARICKEMVEIEKKNYRETGLVDSEKKKVDNS